MMTNNNVFFKKHSLRLPTYYYHRDKVFNLVTKMAFIFLFTDFEGPRAPVGWTAVATSSSNTITEQRHKLCLFNTLSTNRQSLSSLYRSVKTIISIFFFVFYPLIHCTTRVMKSILL